MGIHPKRIQRHATKPRLCNQRHAENGTRESLLNRLAPWLALLFVVAMLWIFFAADRSALPGVVTLLYAFPYGDKVGHFVLMGLLTVAVNVLLPRRISQRGIDVGSWILLPGSLLTALGVTLEELSQLFFSARTFSGVDLLFSFLGILVADFALRKIFKVAKLQGGRIAE